MTDREKALLFKIADLHDLPMGAFNIRVNGKGVKRNSTAEIQIEPKKNKPGIDIIIQPNVIGKSVHIPVILSQGGLKDMVYNDFYVGENCDVVIVAGCGIHNDTNNDSQHEGIHSFHLSKNAKVRYIEKHFGDGKGQGDRVFNPTTKIHLDEGATLTMETMQIGGVSHTVRNTNAILDDKAKLIVKEKVLTTDNQTAKTNFKVTLKGEDSSVEVISRSVAKDNSHQIFKSKVEGQNRCFGRVECDAIMTDHAVVGSIPEIVAKDINASLIHEASIGKIAGEQLIKLMTLGLDEKQAEDMIIQGFLNS